MWISFWKGFNACVISKRFLYFILSLLDTWSYPNIPSAGKLQRFYNNSSMNPVKHLLRTQNVSERNLKHFLFLGGKQRHIVAHDCFYAAQTGKTFVADTKCF